jgi:anti-sigma factor RsiW
MSCSPFDLKDFFFGELNELQSAEMSVHLETCTGCREELERLRLTQAALRSLPEEDPPRRIAFVSDRVFEPRWWQVLWNSAPRLGFASASLLAAAILVHAFVVRPLPQAPAAVDTRAIEARVDAAVAGRIDTAVQAAVARSESLQAQKATQLVEAARRDLEFERRADRVQIEEILKVVEKKFANFEVASFGGQP